MLDKKIQQSTEELRLIKPNRESFSTIKRKEVYVILDRINNGYNIGAILRTSDAFLIKKVFIIKGQNSPSSKTLKAAKGATKWVPHEFILDGIETVNQLKKDGVKIISVELCQESIELNEFEIPAAPICLIFGSEVDGVSESLLEASDHHIHIKMNGMCNSLNVANCAAIILHRVAQEL